MKNFNKIEKILFTKRDFDGILNKDLRPWRSWIARQTPTLKAAGSNPVGRTSSGIPNTFRFRLGAKTALCWEFLRFSPRKRSAGLRGEGDGDTAC